MEAKPWSAPTGSGALSLHSLLTESPTKSREWDTRTPLEQRPREYDPLQDKFLKFHRPSRSSHTAAAAERLRRQRELYRQIKESSGEGAIALVDLTAELAMQSRAQRNAAAGGDGAVHPEEVAARARERLYWLWDELAVPTDHREHIMAVAFQDTTPESIGMLHSEIQRLVSLRAASKDLAEAIDVREGFVYLLQELAERIDQAQHPGREAKPLISNIRKASFAVVEKTKTWRLLMGYDAVYLWRGVSYLCKMATDLAFMAGVPQLQRAAGCAILGNPLLNPAKELASRANPAASVAPGTLLRPVPSRAKMLPPLLQKSTASASVTLAFPPEAFADAEALIAAEYALFASYLRNQQQHAFDPIDASAPDPTVVQSLEACRFVPDDFDELMYQQDAGAQALSAEAQREILDVIKIQKLFRGAIDRRRARALRQRHAAAMRLQQMYRCWAAKRELERRREAHNAAAKIQALARGAQTRQAQEMLTLLNAHAARIQALFRGHRARRVVDVVRALHRRATMIQKVFRGWSSRRRTAAYKAEVYNHAAAEIQKVWKGRQLRAAKSFSPVHLRAAVRIQTWIRRILAVTYVMHLREINRAAQKIQAAVKGGYERRHVVAPLLAERSTALDAVQ